MTIKMRKSTVTANIKKNRLIITLHGKIRKPDLESIYTDIRFCVGDLHEGFDVITDTKDCRIGYLTGIATFIKIQNFLKEKKVGRVFRIAGEHKTFLQQFQRITNIKDGYNPVSVQNLDEAEKYLSNDEQISKE